MIVCDKAWQSSWLGRQQGLLQSAPVLVHTILLYLLQLHCMPSAVSLTTVTLLPLRNGKRCKKPPIKGCLRITSGD